ncbi:mammalian cell entry protein [Nocardia sp. 852002-20019_SCH5090214]|jgi:phospholipid/cholesterol/gamma-HCH transport system substrate-binding protein|uniref:MCE family protein n=1 Tax=Nocardia nova TaxID=37330 RepID=A0A2S6A2W9_9NOCA|nr:MULTISPECIES: MCE family protein [Nocardia]OBF86997.1 mammalian cell entry protein [Mycobacterium sp. 852002-51759_SCH5129042]MBF6276705.1 MCE family protein [Nocardia nova]MBV7707379.1 MCE family protein [Nocardia nova]OBA40455.1 mammalian cell entry protein [Nocardia sp. 852002-20019_SCH5090214]OBA45136.1 mammalian cell entry protein [Nocardia sp. 852002-51101_SCH5132738]
MLHYRGAHLLRPGLVGIVVMVCVILIGLQSQKFMAWGTTVRYQALFGEAAGLAVGDDVIVSGVRVGTVQKVVLHNGDALVVFSVNSTIRLGADSSAHIKTSSLLGKRDLTVVSAGTGRMRSLDTIPASRTSSPYSLTDAVGDLSTKTSAIDIDSLNRSLDMLSSTLNQIAPQVGPAFDGLTQLSKTINSRNESLRQLLTGAGTVTSVLAQRSEQVNTLILNANALVDVLAQRRQEIVDLLANTSAVAKQLSGLVADNEAALGPTLDRLNSIAAMLEKNRDNIGKAIPGYAKVALTQGEAVSGGRFYNAYVANLIDGQDIQPFIDRAFGVNPPAQFPLPHPEPPR